MGLMQLMPATARDLGVAQRLRSAREHPRRRRLPRTLLDPYNGNEELALAAYNAGAGAVNKYGGTIPPYRETRDYVSRIQGKAGTNLGART